jgi:hypothetical protein
MIRRVRLRGPLEDAKKLNTQQLTLPLSFFGFLRQPTFTPTGQER